MTAQWQRVVAAIAYEQRRARNREAMLRRVRYRWITGVLEPSLTGEARIHLGMTSRRANGPPKPLPAGTPISTLFEQSGGGLLILGAPGSGKTTALLELARDLLDHAEADHTRPMPVVFNLSSWAQQQPPLAEWLIGELRASYGVPGPIARQWVAAGEVLPLLDGLDEVAAAHRDGCVEAIDAFQAEQGRARFAVQPHRGARCAGHPAAGGGGTRAAAPDPGQVADCLQVAGSALADVRAAVDADETLCELLQSPLVLNIVALTCQGRPADALRPAGGRAAAGRHP